MGALILALSLAYFPSCQHQLLLLHQFPTVQLPLSAKPGLQQHKHDLPRVCKFSSSHECKRGAVYNNYSKLLLLYLVHRSSIIKSLGHNIVERIITKYLPTPTLAAIVDLNPEGKQWVWWHEQVF